MFLIDKALGETQIEPSFKTMLEWVAKQPADKEYVYTDECACACAQFAQAIGQMASWENRRPGYIPLWPRESIWRRLDTVACGWPRTFGALAERLRGQL
jgi:hypothetical protein